MRTLIAIAVLAAVSLVLVSCAPSSAPQQAKDGDYATEPGGRPPGG